MWCGSDLMSPVSVLIGFILSWWTALFAVLPWGLRQENPQDHQDGQMPGAPDNPNLKVKFLVTTGIAVLLTLIVYILIQLEVINFFEEAEQMMIEDRQP